MKTYLALPLALTLLARLAACTTSNANNNDSGSNTGALTPCDPLAAKPITLGTIIGIGKDTDGTLYVDAANGVFVSDGNGKLLRQDAVGTGQSGNNEFLITFGPAGGDTTTWRNLLVETQGAKATAMALGPTSSKAFLNAAPPGITTLTLVDASTVAGLTVVNTGSEISYVADVSNGDVLVATVPVNADSSSSTGAVSIFCGPPAAVAQRPVTALQQTLSGTGTLTFLVGKVPYVLAFGNEPAPDAGPLGVFTLIDLTPQGDAALTVTLRTPTPTAPPAGLSFACLP